MALSDTRAPETALRNGVTKTLQYNQPHLNGRELTITDAMTLEQVSAGQMPICIVGHPQNYNQTPVSHDSVEFTADVPFILAISRGLTDIKAADALALMAHTIRQILNVAESLGTGEEYGVFNCTSPMIEGESYESEIGIAKEYTLSIRGYFEAS